MPVMTHLALHVRDVDACVEFYERFCGMQRVHSRDGGEVAWVAEPGKEKEFILVFIGDGPTRHVEGPDYAHVGFALPSREAVDAIAARAKAEGILQWPPREEPYPVGYYCGVRDPDGNFVEFSFGQPLGPGAPE